MRRDDYQIKPVFSACVFACAIAALVILSPVGARAQATARDTSKAELQARQRALWDLERMKGRLSKRPAEPQLAYQQIREDFEQLQLMNYDLSGQVGASPDYAQIKKDSSEIKKRAERLKLNLSLPEPTRDEKQKKGNEEPLTAELKAAIGTLDALVKSFVWSPVFQQPEVVDVEKSIKARRDLEGIIRLSDYIHKCAEASIKSNSKN